MASANAALAGENGSVYYQALSARVVALVEAGHGRLEESAAELEAAEAAVLSVGGRLEAARTRLMRAGILRQRGLEPGAAALAAEALAQFEEMGLPADAAAARRILGH
jgi:hypothetical protein